MGYPSLDLNNPGVIQNFKESGFGGDSDFASAIINGQKSWVDVTITAAQALASFTTPVVVIAAPGAGKAIIVESAVASLVYVSATYAWNAGGALLKYKADASGASSGITFLEAFLESSSGTNVQFVRGAATAHSPDINQPLVFQSAAADPTTGDSPIKIRVYYRVVPVPLPSY